MPDTWYVVHDRIEEQVVPGKRLGRHVRHDSRNRRYAWQRSGSAPASQMWARHGDVLDQGNLGSCTGNALVGALECDPVFGSLPPAHPALDETLAVAVYSAAEKLDGGAGYPPEDNGSSGPSAAQAAVNMNLISGFLHCFSLPDVLDALQFHPVMIGANWYQGFDSPDSTGLVTISGNVRGGHEFLCRGVDVDTQTLHFDNSWGTSWGADGSFSMSYATLERLLGEQGDATIALPLSVPAPSPEPVPVQPVPADEPDLELFRSTYVWAEAKHHVGENKTVAGDLRLWYAAKGFR